MNSSTELDLERLLGEPVEEAMRRAATEFDRATASSRGIVLVGAGTLGKKVLRALRENGNEVLAFADNNSALWGQQVDGVEVLSRRGAAERHGASAAFVVTIWFHNHSYLRTREELQALGCRTVESFVPLLWKLRSRVSHTQFEPPQHYIEQKERILAFAELLSDRESVDQLVRHMRWRMRLEHEQLPPPSLHDQYFPEDFVRVPDDTVFVDCGAYDGDTIRQLLRINPRVKRIVAFEPDALNFVKLQEYLGSLVPEVRSRITAHQTATGSSTGKVRFDTTGGTISQISDTGGELVDCVAIDDELYDLAPSFIKLDLEGGEMEALRGARRTIADHRPLIAVSAYHKPDDMWELGHYLHALGGGGYDVHLRSHQEEGSEIVLYLVPRG
jgi:FkbM family methyltransferase